MISILNSIYVILNFFIGFASILKRYQWKSLCFWKWIVFLITTWLIFLFMIGVEVSTLTLKKVKFVWSNLESLFMSALSMLFMELFQKLLRWSMWLSFHLWKLPNNHGFLIFLIQGSFYANILCFSYYLVFNINVFSSHLREY